MSETSITAASNALGSEADCGKPNCCCGGAGGTTASTPVRALNDCGDPTGWMSDGSVAPALNLTQWITANRHLMTPPVANKYLYSGADFFAMIVCGPNTRNDFHQTDSEEFLYQIKGDIVVRLREAGGLRDVVVREGETFFIPPNVPHSPQRTAGTIGLVIERRRPATEREHIIFYCPKCSELVHDKSFACKDIVKHFTQAMEDFWADSKLSTCPKCGTRITKPEAQYHSPGAC
ncbi:MAG: 3-hydroxyanthranilate 3,4-dioxygenase [Phycisphaerales bacterium]|nr:3-hydroxyanthranilate 3,4-dioxygenase [Phycisphaerales bacterium]